MGVFTVGIGNFQAVLLADLGDVGNTGSKRTWYTQQFGVDIICNLVRANAGGLGRRS